MPFLTQNVSPGSTIYTDGLKSFSGLSEAGFKHVARNQPLRTELRKAQSKWEGEPEGSPDFLSQGHSAIPTDRHCFCEPCRGWLGAR